MTKEVTGLIFNVQRFSLHDGDGIRTVVFFKGCPLFCTWCANPESQRFDSELRYNPQFCIGCKSCIEVCPTNALRLDSVEGICRDTTLCSECFACADACPSKSLIKEGRDVTVNELIQEISSDKVFFDSSGGGITFSGGEALAQPDFLLALMQELKKQGYNLCIETCLHAPTETVLKIIPLTDAFLCDIKHVDPVKHKLHVGTTPELILTNLKHILDNGCHVTVRIPVIPDFNHDNESMSHIAQKLSELGVRNVTLLPFHQMGESKYKQLGRSYEMSGIKALHNEDLEPYIPLFSSRGIQVQIGG